MKRSSNLPLIFVLVFVAAGLSRPARGDDQSKTGSPNNPQASFQRDMACAGGAAAAQAHLDGGSSDKQKAHAIELSGMTRDIALTSGAAIGLSKAQVETKIASFRANILDGLQKGPDTKTQESDLGRFLLSCALLHAIKNR